jgi:hypothetical protein
MPQHNVVLSGFNMERRAECWRYCPSNDLGSETQFSLRLRYSGFGFQLVSIHAYLKGCFIVSTRSVTDFETRSTHERRFQDVNAKISSLFV